MSVPVAIGKLETWDVDGEAVRLVVRVERWCAYYPELCRPVYVELRQITEEEWKQRGGIDDGEAHLRFVTVDSREGQGRGGRVSV